MGADAAAPAPSGCTLNDTQPGAQQLAAGLANHPGPEDRGLAVAHGHGESLVFYEVPDGALDGAIVARAVHAQAPVLVGDRDLDVGHVAAVVDTRVQGGKGEGRREGK